MRRTLPVLFAVLLVLAATASFGQVVPVFGNGGTGVAIGVQAIMERSGPALSMSLNWTATISSPFANRAPLADIRNLGVRMLPNTPATFAVQPANVDWRDRGPAANGRLVLGEYAVIKNGDKDPDYLPRYIPMTPQWVDDSGEYRNRQLGGGQLTFTVPRRGEYLEPGSYTVSMRFYQAKYVRTKLAGDVPLIGPALTFSERGEAIARYSVALTVVNMDPLPQNDVELARSIPYLGMNPIMINLPKPAPDLTTAFAAVVEGLRAQIAGLEQKLNAATVRPDLPEFRSTVPLKPNGGEAAPRRERGTKPASDDEGGEVRTADAGDVTPPADTSTADKSGSDNEGALVPEKPRTRNVVVVFAFRDDTGRIIRDQRGRLSVTAPDSHEPIAVTGQTEFRLQLPDDGQKHRFDFKAMKSGREWLPGYYTVDPDERRVRIYYTCRR